MRGLGIAAVILTVLSFFLWLGSWSYWMFMAASFGYDHPLQYVAQTCSVVSTIFEMLAILLVAIGLILAAKRLPKI